MENGHCRRRTLLHSSIIGMFRYVSGHVSAWTLAATSQTDVFNSGPTRTVCSSSVRTGTALCV